MGDWLQDRCNAMQKAQQEHIQKSFGSDVSKSEVNDIIKAKSANIGEIHTWNGKKFKKQSNGKWLEVSEHGMTKEQHSEKINEFSSKPNAHWEYNHHMSNASKLSDKEHSDEEVGLGKKERSQRVEDAIKQGRKIIDSGAKFSEVRAKVTAIAHWQPKVLQEIIDELADYFHSK